MKNLKEVPADKKKSLGKLPEKVRNKMGYAKMGKMMKARYGTMAKGDVKKGLEKSSDFKSKLEDFRKSSIRKLRGKQAGPAEEAKLNKMMPSIKDSPSTRESKMKAVKMKLSKLKVGGEMMKAKKGKDIKIIEAVAKKPIIGSGILTQMKQAAKSAKKKSIGGEMKSTKGYGAARTSGMGLQDENLIPGKSMDYYKDLM